MAKSSLKRNAPTKTVGKKILIACEGKQTEPKYFNAIRQDLRLTTVQVLILPHDGTDPLSVVNAVLEARKDKKREKTWFDDQDSAWAVFDGDEHIANNRPNWCQAIQIAKHQKINLAITNPSIEFWYLIHFQAHSAIIARDKAKDRLKQHIPNYDKARCYYPEKLKELTQDAIARAKDLDNLAKQNKLAEYANPCCSGISQLVDMLLGMGN
ncbi:RloB domain-containing protein [Pseudanabaena sp. UWO311]|uniref:RloB family protein n=1 Tax=Pseudanabaena sp. UWO311 TaxID=2487337 RepID=UPI001158174B|nr:RloB family protein [Pseudanabaena sp. UWO311]TYQ24681.1 RloB domain-containing protein [Pseudanabaena sp. UWO311]